MADGTVLLLTGANDPTTDAVTAELDRRGAGYVRLDLGDFPTAVQMHARHDGKRWHGHIRVADGGVDLEEIRSIYYRRPTRFRFPSALSAGDRAYAEAEARIGIGGVLGSLDCRWLSDPHLVARAEWKPLQITVASRCGLTTPTTIISNDPAAAREFHSSIDGPVVCKALSSVVLTDQGQHRITFTTLIDRLGIDGSFAVTTHLLQEWVPKAREARVTVVGDQVLAVAITADSAVARIDWRADYCALQYHAVTVPADVVRGMHRYLAEFGLQYGAFDFVITPDDRWVMLECNPNGQWLWLHHAAGLPIPAAIADLLITEEP